jgi:hypothetical protein
MKPPGYSPPAGTASGIPGASYPVMGSAPVTNQPPRPPMAPAMNGAPMPGAPPQPVAQGNPQMMANILSQLGAVRGQK